MILKILKHPDTFLRQESQPIEEVKPDTQKLMDDMLETMYAASGVGLAAIQVGYQKRICVIDASASKTNPYF